MKSIVIDGLHTTKLDHDLSFSIEFPDKTARTTVKEKREEIKRKI